MLFYMDIISFICRALATISNPDADMNTLLGVVLETGKYGVDVMALLDLLFHGSFLQRKIGLCSVPRKCHIFSRMFTKDNIFCEVLSRDFSTYFVKNDKLVSIVTLTVYEANGRSTLLVIPEWKPSKQFCHFQPQLILQYYYVLEIGTTI